MVNVQFQQAQIFFVGGQSQLFKVGIEPQGGFVSKKEVVGGRSTKGFVATGPHEANGISRLQLCRPDAARPFFVEVKQDLTLAFFSIEAGGCVMPKLGIGYPKLDYLTRSVPHPVQIAGKTNPFPIGIEVLGFGNDHRVVEFGENFLGSISGPFG